MINAKILGMLVAAFVAGSFVASPELRAYAANTVFSTDIVDGQVKTADLGGNSVTAAKIKDGEVKAAEIATDAVGASEIATNAVGAAEIAANAVGASEIAGVGDLVFAECTKTFSSNVGTGSGPILQCDVNGAGSGDVAIATISNSGNACFAVTKAVVSTDKVTVSLINVCSVITTLGTATIAIVVFDTAGVIIP